MEAGMLVNFVMPRLVVGSSLATATRFPLNPGLILEACDEINIILSGSKRYKVMWANQAMTIEWGCYLEPMDE